MTSFPKTAMGMNLDDAANLVEAKNAAVQAVNNHINTLVGGAPGHGFAKLKGLLTLMISYMYTGDRATAPFPYSKIIAPLMARTNFYVMFKNMHDDEQDVMTENFVLTAANLAATGGTRMFPQGFQHKGQGERGPTRSQWIESIQQGSPGTIFGTAWRNKTDLLSQGSGSTAAANSSSLGSMSKLDTNTRNGGARELAVLELRRLPKNINFKKWTNMTDLRGADLTGAGLGELDLSGLKLDGANFTEADLTGADLSAADLVSARGLTQAQIDSATIDDETRLVDGGRWSSEGSSEEGGVSVE